MSDVMNKLGDDELEQVNGGMTTYTDNRSGKHVKILSRPDKGADVLFNLPNGEKLFKTGNSMIIDGKTWYEVQVPFHSPCGWVRAEKICDVL